MFVVAVACTPGGAGPKTRLPPLVATATVASEDVPVWVRGPTDLRPLTQADVGSKTVGTLDAVLVDRGDVVKKGQLLALVRPSDLPDQLAAAKSAVAQVEASRALALRNFEQAQALGTQGLISQTELLAASSAAAGAEAQLASSKAQLGAVATRLGETRLEAPYDGVITARRLDPGALVGPSTGAVVTVARVDILRAFVAATEHSATRLAKGQRAELRLDAALNRVVVGHVERVAPSFDPQTRTLDAEIHVSNADGSLRPGMYGRAAIEVGRHKGVAVVPVEAVQISDDRAYVFVVEGDQVARREVSLGEDLGDRLEVSSGLKPGDEVVKRGIDSLATGMKIRRAAPSDAGPGSPASLR